MGGLGDHYLKAIEILGVLMVGACGWLLISGKILQKPKGEEPPSWVPSELRSSGPGAISDSDLEHQSREKQHQRQKKHSP
jgi:hypothetical protein